MRNQITSWFFYVAFERSRAVITIRQSRNNAGVCRFEITPQAGQPLTTRRMTLREIRPHGAPSPEEGQEPYSAFNLLNALEDLGFVENAIVETDNSLTVYFWGHSTVFTRNAVVEVIRKRYRWQHRPFVKIEPWRTDYSAA